MPNKLQKILLSRSEKIYQKKTFSARGEDILVDSILQEIEKGVYVDVGAHHPFRFSNTYLLYKRGWRGVNIDANPQTIELFTKFRRKDINILAAISDNEETLTYYSNRLGALNTLDENLYLLRPDKFTNQHEVKTSTLKKIAETLPQNMQIDFLNIDIEGYDLKALKTFPFEKFRPLLICIEEFNFNFESLEDSEVYTFLGKQNYKLHAVIPHTLFFVSQ